MGGRATVYNKILKTSEDWAEVNNINKKLTRDFLRYCSANDRSPSTMRQYAEELQIFFVWNKRENGNKMFTAIRKREFISFFGYGRIDLGWSPNRLASFRAVLSSLSNYIERILDDEYPEFKNIVKVLEPIHIETVREKTVITTEQMEEALQKLTDLGQVQEACWLALLFSSGMRKAEVAQMKVEYFTPDNLAFDIMYKTPKIRTKGRGEKGKQVPRYIFKYLFQPYFDKWMGKRAELGIDNEYLFVVKKKEGYVPATVVTFNSWSQRISTLMGIDFYMHSARHAWTTWLKKQGYPDSVIQKLQQWASADMVSVYNDTSDEEEIEQFFKNKM